MFRIPGLSFQFVISPRLLHHSDSKMTLFVSMRCTSVTTIGSLIWVHVGPQRVPESTTGDHFHQLNLKRKLVDYVLEWNSTISMGKKLHEWR